MSSKEGCGGGALASTGVVFRVGPSGRRTTSEPVWVPLRSSDALVSVNIVTVGSLEVVLRSGVIAGPSSLIGFRTSWEPDWV